MLAVTNSKGTGAQPSNRAADWKKSGMMPSQMSINEVKYMTPAPQEATANFAQMFAQKAYQPNPHLDTS